MAEVYQTSPPDEGYSEDPLTTRSSAVLPSWMLSMSVQERTDYVMSIIDGLPTSQVAEIVRRVRPRLYINFFRYVPPEVCLKILGLLDPASLINTARASKEWIVLAMDRKLWEELYILEGFRVIPAEVERFEREINVERTRDHEDQHESKRRATPQRILPALSTDDDFEMTGIDSELKQTSIFGGQLKQEPASFKSDPDIAMTSPPPVSKYPSRSSASTRSRRHRRASSISSFQMSNISSLVVTDPGDNKKKLNWQHIYSQRRRLEKNWEEANYTNFQLPDPNFPHEAHDECIYTIQHSGKYLVSGSRDKTIRIWDLDTRRLVRTPLRAHTGSVLCLQFDADPEEDLIVSGSSDSTVILWKFSTGQIYQRLRKAHRESVLNVRFDKRVLVTCSKDKTIKIFNRRPLHAGDLGYPVDFAVDPVPKYLNNYGYNPEPSAGLPIKPAYTMIGCLEGHGAAVNAVQIHGNEVVSASGDRCVKVWNWPEQTCTRTLIGHSKGIACVQYDGRRIVSGSSDNEVKVFDKESGLEVASLRAHTNLVRTVQAGFGDLPYSVEDDRDEAKAVDNEYFKALDSGTISRTVHLQRGRPRNAGSRKPEDITAYGAKLPPGGGGGKFGRIVSGSYDETIIIWRRDREGVWKAQHVLKQEEAAHAASRAGLQAIREGSMASQPTQNSEPEDQAPTVDVDASTMPFAPGSTGFYHYLIDSTITQGPVTLRHTLQAHPQLVTQDALLQRLLNQIATSPPTVAQILRNVVQAAIAMQQQLHPGPSQSLPTSHPLTQAQGSILAADQLATPPGTAPDAQPQIVTHNPAPVVPNAPLPAPAPVAQPLLPQATPNQPQPHPHAPNLPANMARVFKLQFDARRIICCSQTSIIVGWDFANGDEQIIEASRFFAPVE